MKVNSSQVYLSILLMFFAFSCGEAEQNTEADSEEISMEEEVEEDVPQKVVYYATPSLIEVASIMKSSGAEFSNELLNSPDNSQNYTTHYQQALNLGVYGADLTYSAMFDETQNAINYLNTVKGLADELGMDGAFEADLLQKIEANITDRDALLDIISEFYWSADSYLTDNERAEVASLIITGGWVESMHIACDMANRSPENAEIRNRIAEQKLILKNLILFLKAGAGEDEKVKECVAQLTELQDIYAGISVNQSTGNTVTDAQKGETVIGNETEVAIDQQSMDALCEKLNQIRQSYTES